MRHTLFTKSQPKNMTCDQGHLDTLGASKASPKRFFRPWLPVIEDIFNVVSILIVILMPAAASAATVSALVDRDRITQGESVNLQVSIQDGQGSVDVGAIKDFKVLSRGSSTSVNIVNGLTSREVTYNYTLIPLKEGRLQIPPLIVRTADQNLLTREIYIQVQHDKDEQTNSRDVFVEAQMSQTNPFVGEQFSYTFRLFNAIQIANAQFQPPVFEGFTAQELEKRKNYRRVINGREYAVAEVIYILVPLNSGPKKIDAAILQCDVVRTRRPSNKRRSFFDDRFFGRTQLEPRVLRTDPMALTVRSLPEFNGPGEFSGLVGTFDLSAQLDPATLKAGESATLTLTLNGTGNIMDAEAPAIDLPDDFKVYTDNPEEQISVSRAGYAGRKIFRAAIVPIQAGRHTLPPLSLSYFDVKQEKYVVRSTAPLALAVEPAAQGDRPDMVQGPETELKSLKKQVEFTGRDILPLKQELTALQPHRTISLIIFILFMAGPAAGFGLVKLVLMLTRKEETPAARMELRARKALREAGTGKLPDEVFLARLYRALISAILSRVDSISESLTWKEAQDILTSTGYDPDQANHTARLLEEIESTSYSGAKLGTEEMARLLTITRESVRSLLK